MKNIEEPKLYNEFTMMQTNFDNTKVFKFTNERIKGDLYHMSRDKKFYI